MSAATPVALVTGGSRGIGAGISEALARAGFAVAVNYRTDHLSARAVVERIRTAGGTAEKFQADVTQKAEIRDLHRRVNTDLGPIEALVLNATGPQPDGSLRDLSPTQFQEQFSHFIFGPLELIQACVESMKQRHSGRIVFVGSEVVDLVPAHTAAYTAAKSAQEAAARCWARELARDGITVNVVRPGFIPGDRHKETPDSAIARYSEQVPLGRLGTASDIGNAVAFFCSDSASFITGSRLSVNGGNTLGS